MATLNVAAALTTRLATITYQANGDIVLGVDFLDDSGAVRKHKALRIKVDGSGVYDEKGVQVSAVSPAALVTNLGNIQTNVDAALTNAIAAGKIQF
jgi:hypothetical protein